MMVNHRYAWAMGLCQGFYSRGVKSTPEAFSIALLLVML